MRTFGARAAAQIESRGRHVHAADVIALLREVYADWIGTREKVEELIVFDHSLNESTMGWSEFFAATFVDHATRRQAPVGYRGRRKSGLVYWRIEPGATRGDGERIRGGAARDRNVPRCFAMHCGVRHPTIALDRDHAVREFIIRAA